MAEKANAKLDVVHGDALAVLKQIRGGDLVFELSEELEKVVAAVKETGKGGTLTLKVGVKPFKGGSMMLNVQGDVTASIPKPNRDPSIFYATERNTLQRDDPRQTRMNFED